MGELKPLAFSLLTIVFFYGLIAYVPMGLLVFDESYAVTTPESYQGADIGNYRFVHNVTIDDSNFAIFQSVRRYQFELGGQYWVLLIDSNYNYLKVGRRNYFGIFWVSTDWLTFKHELGADRGEFLDDYEMNWDYSQDEDWTKYRMYNPNDAGIGCEVNLGFNTTTYDSPKEAFDNKELVCYIGMGIDNLYSTLNAWQLIGMIMFFQVPDINPVLGYFLGFTLWFFFVFPIVLIMLKFIPFVGD